MVEIKWYHDRDFLKPLFVIMLLISGFNIILGLHSISYVPLIRASSPTNVDMYVDVFQSDFYEGIDFRDFNEYMYLDGKEHVGFYIFNSMQEKKTIIVSKNQNVLDYAFTIYHELGHHHWYVFLNDMDRELYLKGCMSNLGSECNDYREIYADSFAATIMASVTGVYNMCYVKTGDPVCMDKYWSKDSSPTAIGHQLPIIDGKIDVRLLRIHEYIVIK